MARAAPDVLACPPVRRSIGAVLVATACAGCLPFNQLAYNRDELKAELVRRAPASAPEDLIVPFEVDEASVALARSAIAGRQLPRDQVRALAQSLFDPSFFGIRYAEDTTKTALETLRSHEGNCMSVASVFVGLARALGMETYYVDVSRRVNELERQPEMAVRLGHLTAFVETGSERLALDSAREGPILQDYHVLSDVEAVAHFLNNRGFERIVHAQQAGKVVDWWSVLRDFRLAMAVDPALAQVWNNAGIAWSHLGEPGWAVEAFHEAARLDPNLAAPHNNLGLLLSQRGEHLAALGSYRRALELEPQSAHVRLNYGVALLRQGDRAAAMVQARAALAIDADNPAALRLVNDLAPKAQPLASPKPAVAARPLARKLQKLRLGTGEPLSK